jgi:hypothetical protein
MPATDVAEKTAALAVLALMAQGARSKNKAQKITGMRRPMPPHQQRKCSSADVCL